MSGRLSPQEWHARFVQQAEWTKDIRRYLFDRARLRAARRVLDVGCGTGVITTDLVSRSKAEILGLDLNEQFLGMAMRSLPSAFFLQGNALAIPFASESFDLVVCHFVLLWIPDPVRVVAEMARLLKPGGAILALAEPDYGGRIDFPFELALLGDIQRQSLQSQGADPWIGRKLAAMFRQAGLHRIETGVLGGQWASTPSLNDLQTEWRVLESDFDQWSGIQPDLEGLKRLDEKAWQEGKRVLFVPTFYTIGFVPLE